MFIEVTLTDGALCSIDAVTVCSFRETNYGCLISVDSGQTFECTTSYTDVASMLRKVEEDDLEDSEEWE